MGPLKRNHFAIMCLYAETSTLLLLPCIFKEQIKKINNKIERLLLELMNLVCHMLSFSFSPSLQRHRVLRLTWLRSFLQASSQSLFGADLDSEGPPTLTPEVPADLFAHSGSECAASSYSNMEEVD